MNKVTVVFPMGGEGQRFGNKFKPFLKIFDKTFIELAIEPFIKYKDNIKQFVFIVRKDHHEQFNVSKKIESLALPVPFTIKQIDKTDSPVATVNAWLEEFTFIEKVIFCDCDHSVDVTNIFNSLDEKYDSIIMGYNISLDEVPSWSVVSFSGDTVKAIAEKQTPHIEDGDEFKGVIGCYYFNYYSVNQFKYFSDVISNLLIQEKKVKIVSCDKAEFFGDPKRLNNLYKEKNASTVFCDIDGTIIRHENIPDYTKKLEILKGAKEKIIKWREEENCFIVLTTSRDEQYRQELEMLLREAGIPYEYLIMNLPPGPRFLINDKKPYSNKKMALALEVERDVGIENLNLGHSLASLEQHKNFIIKKIPQNSSEYQKEKLKSQYDSMKKISESKFSYCVPSVGVFNETSYTMENLIGYCGLHLLSSEERYIMLEKVFLVLCELYNFTDKANNWLNKYISEKIIFKQNNFTSLGLDKEYNNIISLLKQKIKSKGEYLEPKKITSFYIGDLTYENILTNGDMFKLIDFDNDDQPGVVENDLGKLLQSYITKYEWWDDSHVPVYSEKEFNLIIRFYSNLVKEPLERIVCKGNFYCALHLFRMVPYQAQKSIIRAKKAANLCYELLQKV